jgi:hypothetical protein
MYGGSVAAGRSILGETVAKIGGLPRDSKYLGHFQISVAFGWWTSLPLALAGMFLLTASAHWGKLATAISKSQPSGSRSVASYAYLGAGLMPEISE